MTQSTSEITPAIALKESDGAVRRTRLREFQAQLVARMHAATTDAQTNSRQLGVMIGETRFLLNLQEAGEIVSIGAICKVPLTQHWFLGLTNIRGNLISVVDIAQFRGLAPTPIDKESRIVAFAPSLSFNCGLLVSRVMGLRNVAEMELQHGQDSGSAVWATQRYLDRESQIWTELSLSLIVQDPLFLHVAA